MENMEEPIKVYIKINSNNEIVDIGSSIFISNTDGWIKVDEGYGDKFAHAQSQYLSNSLVDEISGEYNYLYTDNELKQKRAD